MSASRSAWPLVLGTSLTFVLSLALPVAAGEEGEGSPGQDPSNVIGLLGASPADLLGPASQFLSGPAWLATKGVDPSAGEMPTYDPWTGTDLSSDVRTQAAGAGAPVPYRDPGPAFSRNLLVTRDYSNIPFQTEPMIEADPEDPQHLVLGVIDYAFPSMST
ncbi:MAG: hypothetical protein AB8I80_17575, partial [Anaerolineae bacterium]